MITTIVQGQPFIVRDGEIPADGDCGVVLEDGTFVTVACADRIHVMLAAAAEHGFDTHVAGDKHVFVRNDWRSRLARRIAGRR